MGIMVEVDGNIRLGGETQNAFQIACRSLLDGVVDFFNCGLALGHEFEINNRHIRRWHAN